MKSISMNPHLGLLELTYGK